ncbi:transcription initiation factor IIB [Yasminevirus sp. GU-2018]|uniref:Transcription initiation factor IIB n=1 Tax=Yasminevirus sp. GU-2018 TaxID=2420051 RepID=A0A5K0U9A7_9VIRU|nr:transcription initiation factor IIB [Yasminevirus sp. GU-2018]
MAYQSKGLTNCELEDILNEGVIHTKKQEDTCPDCGSTNFIEDYTKGIIFCGCGQVIDTIFDNGMERRNHDGDDNDNVKSGMVHNRLLPQSSLGTSVTAKGRLKKLHIWNAMPYKERSDNIMFKKIHNVCVVYGIVRKIEDDAKILCKRVSGTVHKTGKNKGKPIITRGFNRSGIVAGCLFIACRRNDETRAVKEIAFYFDISERDVNKGIRSLLAILDDDSIVKDIGTSKVIHFIRRKCDELQIKNKYTEIAKTIANNIDKLNIASNHTTYSLAAASILLMADMHGLKSITKKKLSQTFCGLSDVTIGKTYNQIKDLRRILIDDAKVDDICKEITKQRNKRIISQEVYDQMVRFGVDTSKYILKGHEREYESAIFEKHIPTRYEMLTEQYTDTHSDETSLDNESGDSYDDYAFMVHDVKKTLKELKYFDVLNDDVMDIFHNINTKMNIIKVYIDQWAIEVGIHPHIRMN